MQSIWICFMWLSWICQHWGEDPFLIVHFKHRLKFIYLLSSLSCQPLNHRIWQKIFIFDILINSKVFWIYFRANGFIDVTNQSIFMNYNPNQIKLSLYSQQIYIEFNKITKIWFICHTFYGKTMKFWFEIQWIKTKFIFWQ